MRQAMKLRKPRYVPVVVPTVWTRNLRFLVNDLQCSVQVLPPAFKLDWCQIPQG